MKVERQILPIAAGPGRLVEQPANQVGRVESVRRVSPSSDDGLQASLARAASICICSLGLLCASGGAAGQSLGDIVGRIGQAGLGIGEASVLQASRAPDGPFRKDASDYNPELTEELAKLLPPGTDLRLAATGFRNLGEFVTAVRVSSNLAIPFHELKERIVAREEVSDAIVSLRPDVDGLIEARRARQMARDDLT